MGGAAPSSDDEPLSCAQVYSISPPKPKKKKLINTSDAGLSCDMKHKPVAGNGSSVMTIPMETPDIGNCPAMPAKLWHAAESKVCSSRLPPQTKLPPSHPKPPPQPSPSPPILVHGLWWGLVFGIVAAVVVLAMPGKEFSLFCTIYSESPFIVIIL
ncbi:hypothetical protein EYF80_003191 [Liparis tanakae]|uniref:Uncharacterized protein n=1 Tax=Liparis tanakae TaxID=230148 RepID=A0A4Z2J931_9TELE|nr:hypothetical protein EYF80_003191 [Liparis tanakae]